MKTCAYAAVLGLTVMTGPAFAEDAKDGAEEEPKTVAELTEGHTRTDGLLTLFRDEDTGEMKLAVPKSLIGEELIYVAQASDGVVQVGYFRGAYLTEEVISFERRFDKIDLVSHNTSFYFDPDNALSRAAEANISDALLATEKVLAEDDDHVLIAADSLFRSEALLQIKPSPNPEADPQAFSLGSLSDSATRVLNLRSYPNNTDVEVAYVYSNPQPKGRTGGDITDRRHVEVRVLHSFVAMPDNDFTPRFDDPRVGYFTNQVTDLTSFSATPYRDVINRWNLVKQDPSAAVSEPVEPITFWIENTTPVEYRDLIRSAALEWNRSFEQAGFRNAVVVKVQPDDAQWDAGDVRYNVLRWTSSPNPPFGGYGPSFTNPRTGQIIGADIMLEYSFLNRYTYARHLLSDGASILDASAPADLMARTAHFCSLGAGLRAETSLGRALAQAAGQGGAAIEEQLVHDSMHYLILHEIGHTLGLNHNMKATQLLGAEAVFEPQVKETGVLAGSVMDYPAVNFAPTGVEQTLFYTIAPGPYDDWAIRFGYDPALDDAQAMQAHLARSTEPSLAFGNDADDMRAPGKAIDPRVNIYDMSSDAVGYADTRMGLIVDAFTRLAELPPADGKSWQETHDVFGVLARSWARSAAVTSRYIGGVQVNRAMVGQPGGEPPYTAVDAELQRRAMQVLTDRVFAPGVVDPAAPAFRYLAQQRRGFNFFGSNEDPKIHDVVLAVQGTVLDHLLHPATLKRITDSSLYGNEYSLSAMFGDLTDAVFAADARGNVDSIRRGLQIDYVRRLAALAKAEGGFDTASQSMAIYTLQRIDRMVSRKRGLDTANEAHVAHLRLIVERALDADA